MKSDPLQKQRKEAIYIQILEGIHWQEADLLNLVKNENKTFIFVTHSIEEAVYVSDQVALLLPRPSRVSEIIKPSSFKNKDINSIRKDSEYLDTVERIWKSLRSYVE